MEGAESETFQLQYLFQRQGEMVAVFSVSDEHPAKNRKNTKHITILIGASWSPHKFLLC